jgi:multiple sugar transport system ATP-binding protein
MGMETMIHFRINGTDVCGRVSPNAGARDGQGMKLMADLNNMHLIDGESGRVL